MTTITNTDIPLVPSQVQVIDRHAESAGKTKPPTISSDGITLLQYSPTFAALVGPNPTHSLLYSTLPTPSNASASKAPVFHEACVYIPSSSELYITSNLLPPSTSAKFPQILISRIQITRSASSNAIEKVEWAKLRPPQGMEMPNGGVNYKAGLLFCAQGGPTQGSGGIWYMPLDRRPPEPVVTNWYGRDFNSVNDVVVSSVDGAIWFTDPCYGVEQGFRTKQMLPGQVYRYDVETGECRVVADGFDRPNGICFSPDEKKCYVTDTGYIHGDGTTEFARPASIYVFDIDSKDGAPFLVNKRLFAFAAEGIPDGIKCDVHGNVYSGCFDGVEVWNPAGSLIGRICVSGGVANFCFGKEGELFLCNEQRLWRVQLAESTRGALLGI